jgi:hypothetical protein
MMSWQQEQDNRMIRALSLCAARVLSGMAGSDISGYNGGQSLSYSWPRYISFFLSLNHRYFNSSLYQPTISNK